MYRQKMAMQLWHHPCGGPCTWNLHCGVTLQEGQQLLVAVQVEQCSSRWWLLEEDRVLIGGDHRSWSTNSIRGWTVCMRTACVAINVRIICFAYMLTFALMHHPYLVCILFGMPSLHPFTFLMFFYFSCTVRFSFNAQLHIAIYACH